jgi:hypothetical protein
MRTLILVTLIIGLAVASPTAAQDSPRDDRPSAALFSREATRRALLAAAPGEDRQAAPSPMADWGRVRGLDPGTMVQLETETHPLIAAQVLTVNNAELVVLHLDSSVAPTDARVLRQYALEHADDVLGIAAGRTVINEHVQVGPDGVFIDGRRIGDADRLFERVRRERVVQIRRQAMTKGSALGGCLGTVGGFFGGLVLAMALHNDADALAWVAFLGTPVAGGYLGYRAGGGERTVVVYRR